MEISTRFLFQLQARLAPTEDLGPTALGHRRRVPLLDGAFNGPLLSGTLEPGGTDWQLERPDGVTIIEAHYSLRTVDGAILRIINKGFRRGPAEVMARLRAGEVVDASSYYFRAAPLIEAPSGPYGWLNSSLFVSTGTRLPGAVTLDFFEVL